MRKKFLFTFLLAAAFALGFAANAFLSRNHTEQQLKKVTGIGGVFLSARIRKRFANGTKFILGWQRMIMALYSNGTRVQTQRRKVFLNGVHSMKRLNTLNPLQKSL